jgi:hypothetical protein
MRFVALVPAIVLAASLANAQAARPGSRAQSGRLAPPPPSVPAAPQQPIVTPPIATPPAAQTRSPFDATPRTYAPRYDSRQRRRYGPPYYSSASGIGELLNRSGVAAVPEDIAPFDAGGQLTSPVYERPPVVVASRGPDTYYVIPGCYAGNRPPTPQRLPKGCDAKNLKTTPIR